MIAAAPFTWPLGSRVVSRRSGATGTVVGNQRTGWGAEIVTITWDAPMDDTGHPRGASSNVVSLAAHRAARGLPSCSPARC